MRGIILPCNLLANNFVMTLIAQLRMGDRPEIIDSSKVVCLGDQGNVRIIYRLQIQGTIKEIKAQVIEVLFNYLPATFQEKTH